jgi:hypothetical protein
MRSVRARSQTRESNGDRSVVRWRPRGGVSRAVGIRPGGLGPALHRDRDQTRVREHRVDLLALEAVVVGDVRARADAQGLAREPDQTAQALRVVQLVVEQVARDGALGEVVHPLPAAALRAHHLAVHQRALDGDLRARPVPPLAGLLRAAQVGGRERAFGLQLLDDLVVRAVRQRRGSSAGGPGRRGGGRRSAATPRRGGCRRRATSTRRRAAVAAPCRRTRGSSRRRPPSCGRPRRDGRTE